MSAPELFAARPHRTVVALSLPILGSLLAEPFTGMVDTAFVARLGAEPLAALGVGTMVLSALFWAFSFLGVATQTRIATLQGAGSHNSEKGRAAARMCLVAVTLALMAGVATGIAGLPLSSAIVRAMGADGEVAQLAETYLKLRLIGAPAMLATFAAFGALRGAHDMSTPLWVAGGMNAVNIALDPVLIFGLGGFPAMGVAGAAIASSASQWIGAAWAAGAALRRLGPPDSFDWRQTRSLLAAGFDLFLRAASLNAFLILGTRQATLIGPSAGAVHQVVRSTWFFNALFMDSFAISGQSLVAHFLGNGDRAQARRAALVVCLWSTGAGAALGLAMLAMQPWMIAIYIPSVAATAFPGPWRIAAATQPISGVTFGTDGVHFGTGDFGFLRNVVLAALLLGSAVALWPDPSSPHALSAVWCGFSAWAGLRAVLGALRVWPGVGRAPLSKSA